MTMARRMRVANTGILLALGALLLAAVPAAAQTPAQPQRGDFALVLGLGYASAKGDCSNCSPDGEYGSGARYTDVAAIAVAPVWRVNSKLVAGVELQLETSGNDARAVYLLGTARFHPWAGKGFFLRGGYGLVQVKAPLSLPDGTVNSAKYRGMAVSYGAGWLFSQGRRLSWGPYGAHYVGTLGSAVIGSFEAQNIIGNTWVAGAAFVFN